MQAAVGSVQLGRLPGFLERRRHLASRYDQALRLLSWLETPFVPANCLHNYQSYMVKLIGSAAEKRDAIMQALLEKNISTRRGIMATHREIPYREGRWEANLPQTNLIAKTALILPLFHQMTESDQDYVIEALYSISA
jgi:dTDP-4-amino-4,6-dideoxygalactose transaminase